MNTNLTGNTINNYNIEAYITEGGMGKIYRAKHTSLGRLVVVKQLHSQFTRDKHFKERFLNEAKILAKLNHQNIITVYDFIEDDNEFMIIMEYVDGDTIGKVIEKQGGGFHYARAINIFKQILSGFNYAHSEGIVHRDIKPTNIILQQNDVPKILDFGIARMLQKDLRITKAGTKMGSLLYMSPEQVLGLDVDSRSDIYSLGLLLYEMLSGDLPYNIINDTDYEIMECILKEEIKDINALIPGLPYGTGNIIRKACAKNTTDRFQTCNEFITALDKGTAPPIKNEVYQRITTKNSSQNKTTYQSPGGQY
ncbi:MAG TPA: serine/threonine-protein kinase, partial [Ignavibacteria bacterium]